MVEIVEFTPPYQKQVVDLILNIQQNEFYVPITLTDQPDLVAIPSFYQDERVGPDTVGGNFWIAIHQGKVAGTIALLSFTHDQAALRKMFVAKEFRGKELGTAQRLLDTLLTWSKGKGIREIYLGTLSHMLAAQSFYRRNGFVEIRNEELPEKYLVVHVDSMFFVKSVHG